MSWVQFLLVVAATSAKASFVVDGTMAPEDAYPGYAHSGGERWCGGTLVHDDIVLTAAQCGRKVWPVHGVVYIGATHQNGWNAKHITTVDKFMIHPDYNADFFLYDAMLVKLKTPATNVTPYKLAAADGSDDPVPGDGVTFCGFGGTEAPRDPWASLLQVTVNTYSMGSCNQSYSCVFDDISLCAGSPKGGMESCQGDSGGPLFYNGVQVGMVSHGDGCALPNVPAVYTKISGLREWIDNFICYLSNHPPPECYQRRRTEWMSSKAQGGGGGYARAVLERFSICGGPRPTCPRDYYDDAS